ncbi:uncharacterized protein LOC100177071 [Ciona intestinalis]
MAKFITLFLVAAVFVTEKSSAQSSFFDALFKAASQDKDLQGNIPQTGAALENLLTRSCYVCHGTSISAVTSSCWETVDEDHTRFVEVQQCFGQCSITVLNHTSIGLVEFTRRCESNCTASCYHTDQNTDLCKYCCTGDRCNGIVPNYVPSGPERIDHVSKDNLQTWLRGVLSKPRQHAANPSNKLATRKFIKNMLGNFGLASEMQAFTISETIQEDRSPFNFRSYLRTVMKGFNIVSVIEGRHYGTINDKLIVLMAHYDTHLSTRGVNDNGSGVSALLEIARLLLHHTTCTRNYSVVLVFTDFKEQGSFLDGLAGTGYTNCFVEEFNQLSGAAHFLCGWLLPHLRRTGSRLMFSVNLHSLLNFDSRALSQSGVARFSFENDNARVGDWILSSFAQVEVDSHWTSNYSLALQQMWKSDPSVPGRFMQEQIPASQRSRMQHDDCLPFLLLRNPLPCITITDTGPLRGYMRRCHNNDCDDVSHVTTQNLDFLAKSTNAVWRTVEEISESNCPMPPNPTVLTPTVTQGTSTIVSDTIDDTDDRTLTRRVEVLETCHSALVRNPPLTNRRRNSVVITAACKYARGRLVLCRSPISGVWANLRSSSAWIPKKAKRRNSRRLWLKIDFGRLVNVTDISVQGVPRKGYVSRFMLSFSNNGITWHWHFPTLDSDDTTSSITTELIGNKNWKNIARNDIRPTIQARFLRIHPRKWHRRIAMRVEAFGCDL